MSHINRSCYKSEVKSKIGDYIRGKISAQSLMHPSRVNTKPIDKRKYNLHSGTQYETTRPETRTDYQKKIRRPPLKDYIEGKVKLCDMISPSKITYIPKERKYHNLLPQYDVTHDEQRTRNTSFADSVGTSHSQEDVTGSSGFATNNYKDNWDTVKPTIPKAATAIAGEYSLVPLRSTSFGPPGKRKLMCKIKVQRNDTTQNGNAEPKTEEHIIEIPEKVLRHGHHSLPKFLMDRYNIPCYVNGKAGGTASKQPPKRKQPLSILAGISEPVQCEEAVMSPPPPSQKLKTQAIEYPVADGESHVEVDAAKNSDVDNIPSEQGDYNNATTYVFEFYEEEVPHETKSAIIEEIEDDHSHREYAKSFTEDTRFRHGFNDSMRSDEFQHYEDFKSNIYVQRELMDLHRGMLKCDKNFMVVEHNVNQVMASLNMIETVQNQEIKPTVMTIKTDNEKMRHQLQTLTSENEELKKSVQYLRKKTTDYDKVIYYIRHDSNMKIQELENKLETLTQTQVKSIEMQNTVNKNIIQITHGMKRVYSEQDSKHCCNSIKSPKNSNLTIS